VGWVVVSVLVGHGLIHLMGFAKAFGYAELPQLTQSISRAWGVAWLVAAILIVVSAIAFGLGARRFWALGAVALVISQAVIVSSWRDAWAGSIANLVLLLAVGHGWLTEGPHSFHAQFVRDADAGRARAVDAPPVTASDLARLPEPVARYLGLVGVVGQPQVRNFRLRFRGRIRSGPNSPWMPFQAEQQSFVDQPTRLFLMRARMKGLPVESFHRFVDGHATMRVKIAGLVTIVDAQGEDMDRAETVTLFNDMCLLAPATLIDPGIQWEAIDARSTRARFTSGGHTIAATLFFGDDGWLTDFASDDRLRSSPDGKAFNAQRFSTPVRDYRPYGPLRLASHGEARWHPPEGVFTYGEFELVEIAMNVLP
jgi:hypothetical protein